MCSYPESRFGQCIRTCVISDLRFGRSLLSLVGPDLPLADAAHTHSSLRHDRPRTDSHVACLPVCRSLQYISMRNYLFRPCTVHRTMECDTSDLSYIISADRVPYSTIKLRRTLLTTLLYDTTRRSRHHHYTVVEPSVSTIMHFYKLSEKLLPLTQQIKRPLLD